MFIPLFSWKNKKKYTPRRFKLKSKVADLIKEINSKIQGCSPEYSESIITKQVTISLSRWPSQEELQQIDREATLAGWEGTYLWQRNGIILLSVVFRCTWDENLTNEKLWELDREITVRISPKVIDPEQV